MTKHASIADLVADDAGRCRLAHVAGTSTVRLHRNRRGNIALLFIFLALVFYGLVAMVWNTGQTVSAKIQAQTAADASAYSTAVWTSRATNNITAANMLILRSASAKIAATAVITTSIWVWPNWIYAIATTPSDPWGIAKLLMFIWIMATEFPPYMVFLGSAMPGAVETLINPNINELFALQQDWDLGLPLVIDEQRKLMEDYYGCEITLTRPGAGTDIRPPVVQGSHYLSLFPLFLLARYYRSDNNWPDVGWLDLTWEEQSQTDKQKKKKSGQQQSNPKQQKPPPKQPAKKKKQQIKLSLFDMINFGKANQGWLLGSLAGYAIVYAAVGNKHYLLSTDPQAYTVVATASRPNVNDRFVAPGLFRTPVSPDGSVTAYAQAETHNGVKGVLNNTIGAIVPKFVSDTIDQMLIGWSTWGMQWQPRLNHGDLVWNALQTPQTEQDVFSGVDVGVGVKEQDIDAISLH